MTFAIPTVVKALPVQPVSWVNVAPELNVIALGSTASSLLVPPEHVILPLKLPVAPVANVIVKKLVPV